MLRRTPLVTGETYHIFNRGAHKQPIFRKAQDYERFLFLLFLLNSDEPIILRDVLTRYKGRSYADIMAQIQRNNPYVDIYAFSLMSNHMHLIVKQNQDDGVTNFMRKLCTSYSMYFNLKYSHGGTLFQGRFKSSHLDNDSYFKWIFAYVHLNPISILLPEWETVGIKDINATSDFLRDYKYSSYADYYGSGRPERAILAYDEGKHFVDAKVDIEGLIADFKEGKTLGISS